MADKHILDDFLDDDDMRAALRGEPIDELIEEHVAEWRVDLDGSKPASVYSQNGDEPAIGGNTPDLFTTFLALAKEGHMFTIERYTRMRPKQTRKDQRVVDGPRQGQIQRLSSNKDTHAFSVLIKDLNVITTHEDGSEEQGDYRNFSLVDDFGRVRPEWEVGTFTLETSRSQEEFLKDQGLPSLDGAVSFEHFVHPDLYQRAFGTTYVKGLILNGLAERERAYWKETEKQVHGFLERQGIDPKAALKERKSPAAQRFYGSKKDNVISMEVPSLESSVEFASGLAPQDFPWYGLSQDGDLEENTGLRELDSRIDTLSEEDLLDLAWYIDRRKNRLSYSLGPRIRQTTRAVDLSLFNTLIEGQDPQSLNLAETESRLLDVADNLGFATAPLTQGYRSGKTSYTAAVLDGGITVLRRIKSTKQKVNRTEK